MIGSHRPHLPPQAISEAFVFRPMESDHRIEFSSASKTSHWLIALRVPVELALGQWKSEAEGRERRRTLLGVHQSNGLLIDALLVSRLAWRLYVALPEWPTSISPSSESSCTGSRQSSTLRKSRPFRQGDIRAMSFIDCPRFHRSQSSFFCEAEGSGRLISAICTLSWVMR